MTRKFWCFIFALVVLLGLPVSATSSAEPQIANSNLVASNDYDEIALLKNSIQSVIEEAIYENNYEYPGSIIIDLSKAFKIYVDTNIFTLKNNKDSILTALENGTYIWIYPFQVGGDTINVNISKGLPLNPEAVPFLTEEEQKEIIDNIGKWCVNGYSIKDTDLDYVQQTQEIKFSENDTNDFVFVGGLPGFHYPVAVSFNQSKMVSVISLFAPVYIQARNNQSRIMDYDTAARLSVQYVNNLNGVGGGYITDSRKNHSLQILYWFIPIGILAGATVCFIVIRKKRKPHL